MTNKPPPTSFPVVITSHFSHTCKDCDPATPRHLPRTRTTCQMSPTSCRVVSSGQFVGKSPGSPSPLAGCAAFLSSSFSVPLLLLLSGGPAVPPPFEWNAMKEMYLNQFKIKNYNKMKVFCTLRKKVKMSEGQKVKRVRGKGIK